MLTEHTHGGYNTVQNIPLGIFVLKLGWRALL